MSVFYRRPRRHPKRPRYFSKSWRAYQKYLDDYFGSLFVRLMRQRMSEPGILRRLTATPEMQEKYQQERAAWAVEDIAWRAAKARAWQVYNPHRVYVVPKDTTTWDLDYAKALSASEGAHNAKR